MRESEARSEGISFLMVSSLYTLTNRRYTGLGI